MKHPPAVVITYSGQLTKRPQVHVSVHGFNGMQGVYTWDADSAGEARASMYGEGLASIMQRRLIDERNGSEPFVKYYESLETAEPANYSAGCKYCGKTCINEACDDCARREHGQTTETLL